MNDKSSQRRLAAILSADVFGYSRLMRRNERSTVDMLLSYRSVFRDLISKHSGRVVDTSGDSVLAEFASVSEAVICATAIQIALGDRNKPLPEEEQMLFRIGVNLGDIIAHPDGSIYGDGVNIAARLESLAEPGSMALSASVHEQVRDKLPLTFEDLGDQPVKNISVPIRAYRARPAPSGAPVPRPAFTPTTSSWSPPAAAAAKKPSLSIAVLPFVVMGGDSDQDYFADGITEDIITELARFQELSVVARNTTFTYRGQAVSVADVSRDLGVRYVLEGSVRRAGDRIRVTAQLIDGASGHHLWAERFDRKLEDVFAVQDELTSRIVSTIAGRLQETERRRVRLDERPENCEAYDFVLRGRAHWMRFTREDNLEARRLYEQAIEIDPAYARAYSGIAWTYFIDHDRGWADDGEIALDRALEAAQKGIAINPASHSNHLTLGQILLVRGDHDRALRSFERGVKANPNDAEGYAFLAYGLCFVGEAERALTLMDEAMTRNPDLGSWMRGGFVTANFAMRRYEEAVAAMEAIGDPPHIVCRYYVAALGYLGETEKASKAWDRHLSEFPHAKLTDDISKRRYKDKAALAHYLEGIRLSGITE